MTFSTSALARVLKVIAHEFSLTFQITTSAESHCNRGNLTVVALLFGNRNFDHGEKVMGITRPW